MSKRRATDSIDNKQTNAVPRALPAEGTTTEAAREWLQYAADIQDAARRAITADLDRLIQSEVADIRREAASQPGTRPTFDLLWEPVEEGYMLQSQDQIDCAFGSDCSTRHNDNLQVEGGSYYHGPSCWYKGLYRLAGTKIRFCEMDGDCEDWEEQLEDNEEANHVYAAVPVTPATTV